MREHKWVGQPQYTFEFCVACGALPKDGNKKNGPCKGPAKAGSGK